MKIPQLATKRSAFILVMYPFSAIDTAIISAKTSQAPMINTSFRFTLNVPTRKGRSPNTKVIWAKIDPRESPTFMSP